jgi:predicted ATPase/serine/threonine protein kinase
MTPARWARMEALFLRALACVPDEREALLDRECEGDASLRKEVEAMLATHERLGSFLEAPAVERDLRIAGLRATNPGSREVTARQARGKLCEQCGGRFDESNAFCPDDGALLTEDPEALVGTTLDGLYSIEALLGRGGMGAVYRAVHILLRDVVAIKVLPRAISGDVSALRRFRQEGYAARRFRHPSAVTVYDLRMAEDGTAFLVLEYVDGETLRTSMRRTSFAPAEAVHVLGHVASCLDAAHTAGVIHRDVKPENIMIRTSADGGVPVKLLDLGIAKLSSSDSFITGSNLTSPGAALGTPRYMSPEQWGEAQRDGIDEVDGRADVYGLAVVAYEMIAGDPPFAGTSWTELRRQHTREVARPLHERVPGLPEAFGNAVARAMAKDRDDRFATAGGFVDALRRALETTVVGTASERVETDEVRLQTVANPPMNLPTPVTSFVGREREVADVVRLFESERLVTIAGPGGIGKTRLALQVAAELRDQFPDGVWFADLAPLSDPALVVLVVAGAVGAHAQSSQSVLETLCEHARTRRFLLVLDNCEHLLNASSSLVTRLLRSCPGVRVLATSRTELEIANEVVWQTPPLEAREAERLFVERTRSIRQEFAVTSRNAASIESLCRQLEGLPLAVELAAARMRVLTPAQMLERLGHRLSLLATRQSDVPSRHGTLRATIDWSYELLGETERRALAALSVFRGGWTLEAASGVLGQPSPETETDAGQQTADVVEVLDRLRAASLVAVEEHLDEMRYRMLESIREYGLERLAASGEVDELRRRHAAYFLRLAEAADPELKGGQEARWLALLEAELDNLRAALQWLLEHDANSCLRLAVAVRIFWNVHGHFAEGRRWLLVALERSATAPARMRWHALHSVGQMAWHQGDASEAHTYFDKSARVAQEIGDTRLHAVSSFGLGWAAEMQGDLNGARAHWLECLAIASDVKDDRSIAAVFNALGEVSRREGDWAAARAYYEKALEAARRLGGHEGVSASLGNLGAVAWEAGDTLAADDFFKDALRSAQSIGSKVNIAHALDGLGGVAARRGEWVRAGVLSGAASTLREQIGFHLEATDRVFRDRYLSLVRAAVGDETLESNAAEGRSMTVERSIVYALKEP